MKNSPFLSAGLSLVGFAIAPAQAAPEAPVEEMPAVVVEEEVRTTPLPGLRLGKDQIAAPVQTATDQDIAKTNAVNVTDFMSRNLGSVYVNDVQGNPFQPDVNFRGYSASPLLGTPQGLSVYMDAVRLNQPFGDVVSWDLIPKSAIASMAMMPGSNPLFGRNTLGGALSIQTKDGIHNAGTTGQAIYGQYDRHAFEFEHGGHDQGTGLNWYFTGNYFKENGWRVNSPTEIRQIFGKVGWQGERTDVKFTTMYNDNQMYGNGMQEYTLLGRDYHSIYTQPDITDNRALFLNLEVTHNLTDYLTLSGNSYYRNIRTQTTNGDINEDSLSHDYAGVDPQAACLEEAADPQGTFGETCNGLMNRTSTNQENWGTAIQAVFDKDVFGKANHFLVGGAYDQSVASFSQSSQLGFLTSNRGVAGIPHYADGVTGGVVGAEGEAAQDAGAEQAVAAADGAEDGGGDAGSAGDGAAADASGTQNEQAAQVQYLDNRVSLRSNTTTWSFLTEDTLSLTDELHLTASGRYNHTAVSNGDRLQPLGGPDSLNGEHNYSRFNPAVGLAYNPMREVNFYAGYNEGSRAPTAIELGCANPDRPCKLPNAMAGDPPLKQVVTETWEVGLRGEVWKTRWGLGYFHAENSNDIMFVADEQQGFGYFKNFGKTQRQGIEASLEHTEKDFKVGNFRVGDFTFGANYTWLDATFQSSETFNGTGNSTNSEGQGLEGSISVRRGDKIPLIPENMFKTYLDYQANLEWGGNVNVVGFSGMYARGNENNAHQPDGVYYTGKGKSPGYVVTNLGVRYTPRYAKGLQAFAQINNVFDQRYYTAAQLGAAGFDAHGNFVSNPFGNGASVRQSAFYSPGAPRIFWFGLRYSF